MLSYGQSRLGELGKASGAGVKGFKQDTPSKQPVCFLLQGRLAQVALKAHSVASELEISGQPPGAYFCL